MLNLWSAVLIILGILIIQPGRALATTDSVDGSMTEMIRTGRIDALDLKIGDPLGTAFLKYGRPEKTSEQNYYLGSPYYDYGSYYVLYHNENRAEEERPITGFIFLSPSKIFGLEIGRSTQEDVQAILGVSDWEIISDLEMSDEEQLFDPVANVGKIRVEYIIGEYTLDVYFEDDVLRYVVLCRQRTAAQFASAVDVFFDFRNMTQT
jgi:hypothetical protein